MLVPASADELRTAGKFSVTNPETGTKAVQIKVSHSYFMKIY